MDISQFQPLFFMMMNKDNNNSCFQYATILMIIVPIIMKILPINMIYSYIEKYFSYDDNWSTINIVSHEIPVIRNFGSSPMTKNVFSEQFLAILYFLSKNYEKLDSLTEIITNSEELNYSRNHDNKKDHDFLYMPISNKKICISEKYGIYSKLTIIDDKNNDSDESNNKSDNSNKVNVKNIKKKTYIIELSIVKTYSNSNIDIITKFIEKCIYQYNLSKISKDDTTQYIYTYTGFEKCESSRINLKFNKNKMEHNKDLKVNIYFEDKDKLINYIEPFIYNPLEKVNIGEERYKRSGFTFKAGILFYGSPGCGKTSTIKAILKYTGRHGIILNLNKVKTCEELESIFRERTFDCKELNGKQICYILEDCDAFEGNIISSRKKDKGDNDNKDNDSSEDKSKTDGSLTIIEKMIEMSTCAIKKEDDTVNLSCFLNILDGIIELHGVMIIMTTNYPERIDDALIRPGRFDFKYEFKRASKKIIREMVQFKFELSDKEMIKYDHLLNIKDEILSPAEVQSICFKNNDVSECINEIVLACQKKI
jgi:ATP-dependent 26S proteasome regulatory subunit